MPCGNLTLEVRESDAFLEAGVFIGGQACLGGVGRQTAGRAV